MEPFHGAGTALLLAGATLIFCAGGASASDHRDSAGPQGFPAADITGLYAFRSPADSGNLVIALNTNPRRTGEARTSYFSTNVEYIVHIVSCAASATTLTADINLVFTFQGSGATQTFTLTGLTRSAITGTVKQVVTAASGAAHVYCGPRDDQIGRASCRERV